MTTIDDDDAAPPAVPVLGLFDDEPEAPERSLGARLLDFARMTDGTAASDLIVGKVDRVESFNPAILAIRWAATMASIALAAAGFSNSNWKIALYLAIVVSYTAMRTITPLKYYGDIRSLLGVLFEVALHVFLVSTSGQWESPFIFSLLTAIIVAGFARGFGFALRIGAVCAIAVTIPYLAEDPSDVRVTTSAQWTLVLLLVALIAGYARRISGEADRQHNLALDRLGRLADANALLFSLHRVTQTLPASLDLDEVLDTTVNRLRGLFEFDYAAIFALDETDGHWELLRKEGARMPARLSREELPSPMRRAVTEETVVISPNLGETGPGMAKKAGSGMYAVLPARGSVIGVVSIEHQSANKYRSRDVELLRGFVEPVALAIDNARWFGRLRTVGADEERTRIARDLHDRIGQSLAYLAFELDRIVSTESRGEPVGEHLEQLRDDVRGVIREVRDTLYDLRTDVSDSQDLADTLEQFTARVAERSNLSFELFLDRGERLPILQEREMWRVAQEAITNVERHAHATEVRVIWRCNGDSAALDITDNGQGFPIGRAGRLDSYGILGMRERASSIGATLDITSQPGKGARIRCSLIHPSQSAEDLTTASAGS